MVPFTPTPHPPARPRLPAAPGDPGGGAWVGGRASLRSNQVLVKHCFDEDERAERLPCCGQGCLLLPSPQTPTLGPLPLLSSFAGRKIGNWNGSPQPCRACRAERVSQMDPATSGQAGRGLEEPVGGQLRQGSKDPPAHWLVLQLQIESEPAREGDKIKSLIMIKWLKKNHHSQRLLQAAAGSAWEQTGGGGWGRWL